MKMLTSEITKLLDKLYNLRGDNSVILSKMEAEREKAEETKERNEVEKSALQDKIEALTEEETILGEEGEKLVSVLKNIKTDDFKFVLDKLKINFNPDKLSEDVNELLPKTIDRVKEEKESAKSELVKVESEMNTAVATIEELAIRKDEAIANQTRLNEYFDLALNGNINITRDSITSLLEKFDFNEDEQREAAKILMFPEDALYEYEEKLKDNSGMSISDVFAEAKSPVFELKDNNTSEVEEKEEMSSPVISKESPKESLISLLKDLGFDYLDFTSSDVDRILANYNENTLKDNVEFAKNKGLKLDLFVDNAELLYDKEFKAKIEKIIEIGKEPNDIYLNPSILVKYSKSDLDMIVDRLKSSGLDPKKVPLIAY